MGPRTSGPQGGAIRSFYLSSVLGSDMGEKRKKSSSFVLAKKLKTTSFVSFRFMLSIHLVILLRKFKELQNLTNGDFLAQFV